MWDDTRGGQTEPFEPHSHGCRENYPLPLLDHDDKLLVEEVDVFIAGLVDPSGECGFELRPAPLGT